MNKADRDGGEYFVVPTYGNVITSADSKLTLTLAGWIDDYIDRWVK